MASNKKHIKVDTASELVEMFCAVWGVDKLADITGRSATQIESWLSGEEPDEDAVCDIIARARMGHKLILSDELANLTVARRKSYMRAYQRQRRRDPDIRKAERETEHVYRENNRQILRKK